MRPNELIEAVKSYDKKADVEALRRAYVFAEKMHHDQQRESGEKYIVHPLNVAEILLEYKMDCNAIIAALLHDTVEDTPASYESIKALFNKEVADLVQGLTKLESFQVQSSASGQAENFQKLILAASKDVRVLVIKMADRLNNMRTLGNCKVEKRKRISAETMDIYVPLAERLGLHRIKNELEDLSFRELNPSAYKNIKNRLLKIQQKNKTNIQSTIRQLEKMLDENKIKGRVIGRIKMPYSLWRKLKTHNNMMSSIFDILGFRIVVENRADCYRVLGLIHQKYHAIPGRFKDYISTPKDSGYQSLQTSVITSKGWPLEIQIRTEEMESEAQFGIAAHWSYKQGVKYEGKNLSWMQEFLDLMKRSKDSSEFLNRAKKHLCTDKLFCFAADGTLYSLPLGSTVLDFACYQGSKVALKCLAAEVNGDETPFSTRLQDGDKIVFHLSNKIVAQKEWLKWVTTSQARGLLESYFASIALPRHRRSLFSWLRFKPKMDRILGLAPGQSFRLDPVCAPKPGDAIVGILEKDGVVIHNRDCAALKEYISMPERWISVAWAGKEKGNNRWIIPLIIEWKTAPESMGMVVTTLLQSKATIQQISTLVQEHKITRVTAEVRVKSQNHLLDVMDALRNCPVVSAVYQNKDVE